MKSAQQMVRAFQKKFGFPAPSQPTFHTTAPVRGFRIALIREEFEELMVAYSVPDHVDIAHESIDLMVTVLGGLVELGIEAEPVFREVMRANMQKGYPDVGGKPTKPEGWRRADVRQAILDQVHRIKPPLWRRILRL